MSLITGIHQSDIPAIGTPIGGGFASAIYRDGDHHRLLIDSGKPGELRGKYGLYGEDIIGARSVVDGLGNTIAMANAGSELAQRVLELKIGGYADWCIGARDQVELNFRYFKPGTRRNWCSFRDGENPSALPFATYAYTEENPAQTIVPAYQLGGEHAFSEEWYLTSTQYSASHAWLQHFDYGYQDCSLKHLEFAVRVVRSILIIH